jgi:hypothetical protein
MPSRTTALHGFALEAAKQKPTAVISPATQSRVLGSIIKLDGRGSVSPDGDDLTYTWTIVDSPLGSTVADVVSIDPYGGVVTFVPDLTGQYTIGLVVSTDYRESGLTTVSVDVTAILAPYALRTTPDGSFMFKLLSSMYRLVENREVFATIWSGYMQTVGSDFLRMFQVDYAKSISTIQNLFQRRWISYSPRLDLDHSLCKGVYGNHQSGTAAFTASGATASVGVIISGTEVLLLDGTPSLDAVGSTLRVFTSNGTDNLGSYTINRLNSDGSGYIISGSSPFPVPADEVLGTGSDLVSFEGDDEVYVADVGVDFVSTGVTVGDLLRVESGSDADYYRITKVGTPGGLANNRTLELASPLAVSSSGRSYTIFKALRIFAIRTPLPNTQTVYIPEADADLTAFESSTLSGNGTLEGTYELKVEPRHVFSALVGQRLQITSGVDGGRSFTITGLNEAGTGYLVGSAFNTASLPSAVSYRIPAVSDIADRVLVLNGRAYEIAAAKLDSVGVPESEGGYGPVWVITLAEAAAPSSQEDMTWRIAATLETSEFEDITEMGVEAGDLLVIEAVRDDEQFVAEIPCLVIGSVGQKIAFVAGASEPAATADGTLTDEESLAIFDALKIPRAYADAEDNIQFTLSAAEIQMLLGSRGFETAYFNLPISSSTSVDLEYYTVRLRPSHVIRNCRIPVDTTLVSVPSMFQYIDEPTFGTDESGQLVLIGKNRVAYEIDSAPLELVENRDYSLSSDSSLKGTNLQTEADSDELVIPFGDLIDRDVRVGDYVDVTSGFDQGRYVIQAVIDSETLRAVLEDGSRPLNDAVGLSYTLTRRTAGNFLRFVDGMFTADAPAPERFWAQTSFYDNSGYIEANFGVMVGVSKDQLDEYGSTQVSYRGAVQALMFAWTGSPTLKNVAIGCHILGGLPVTEVEGQIIQIDAEYDVANNRGRILIEDLDAEGNGSGLVRIYYYTPRDADDNSLSDFAGLATNPETGLEYAVLDIVPPFTPLSRAVVVSDYVSSPQWWAVGGATGADELQKFHTWEVQVDAREIDSRDMPLIFDFCGGIRPIYTKPQIVLVVYLYDSVEVQDELTLENTIFFSDDPALSIESTFMVDSYNESSLSQRLFDVGALSTRTLFEGTDLVTSAGSATVTSARGGFSGTLSATPLSHAPSDAIGVLPGANADFPDGIYYRGTPLVKAGDIIFIREGVNRGRYSVTAVTDDNTLQVAKLTGWPPTTKDPAQMEAATGQVFQIQRQITPSITSGSATVVSYDGGTDTTIITDASGNFQFDGAAVNDTLVVSTGADYGTHEILEIGYWDTGVVVSRGTHLTISGELTEAGSFSYEIRRDKLMENPLWTGTDGATSAGANTLTSATGGFSLLGLVYGDELIPTSGTDADLVFTVVHAVSDTVLVLDRNFTASEGSVEFKIRRPGLFEPGESDGDNLLEELVGFDDVSMLILEPLTSVLSLSDLDMTANGSTVTSATDMAGGGVTAGMKLHVANTHGNTGVYTVAGAVTTTVTIDEVWLATESSVSGEFFTPDVTAWSVHNDTATLQTPADTNLEFGEMDSTATPESATTFSNGSATVNGAGTTYESTVEVGDIVRLQGDADLAWAKVAEVVSDTELTLDRTYTGTGGAGSLEIGTPENVGGVVQVGDLFEYDGTSYVVEAVTGAVLTLTADTGEGSPLDTDGRVTRRA